MMIAIGILAAIVIGLIVQVRRLNHDVEELFKQTRVGGDESSPFETQNVVDRSIDNHIAQYHRR